MRRFLLQRNLPSLLLLSILSLASLLASGVVAQQPGPPFSPCEVTSIRLAPANADPNDSSQWQTMWSRDGGGASKTLAPFALGPEGSTVLRVRVAFAAGTEVAYRSVVTATVNNNGYIQYFRAPGPSSNPPVFEQELQGFAADRTNTLVLNADCETMFETQVTFGNGDDGGNGGGGDDGGNGGNVPPPQGGFDDDSTGPSSPNDDGAGSSSTASPPPFVDEDGNGIPDNVYTESSSSTAQGEGGETITGTNSTAGNPPPLDGNEDEGLGGASPAARLEAQPLVLLLVTAFAASAALLMQL